MDTPAAYTFAPINPDAAIMEGLQFAPKIQQIQAQKAAQETAIANAKQSQQIMQNIISNPNAENVAQNYQSLALLNPSIGKSIQENWSALNTEQQNKTKQFYGQAWSAVQAGRPDLAIQMFDDKAIAARNSGNEEQAKGYELASKMLTETPAAGKTMFGTILASIPGGDKIIEATVKSSAEQRELEKQPYEIAGTQAETTKKLADIKLAKERLAFEISNAATTNALNQDKLTTETELKLAELNAKATALTAGGEKIRNEAALAGVAASQSAAQYKDLADSLDASGLRGGSGTDIRAWYLQKTGQADYNTQLRNDYARLRSSGVMANLPPGAASDKDVAFALQGVPPANAPIGNITQYLRGIAKIKEVEAQRQNLTADWVNANGSLGATKTDMDINGIQVRKGTPFGKFMDVQFKAGRQGQPPARGYLNKY